MDLDKEIRQYKLWITKNCDRRNCWIVVARLGEMLEHTDTVVTGPDGPQDMLPLTHDRLEYVYLVDFSDQRLITLVQDKDYYYLIDNTEYTRKEGEEDIKDYRSRIMYDASLPRLVDRMPSATRKKLGLKTMEKVLAKKQVQAALNGVLPFDFVGKSHIVQVKLFRDYVQQNHSVRLDLSGLFILDPKVIEDAALLGKVKFEQTEVVLYQNNKFNKFAWLKHFPKVKTLTLWYINQVKDEDINELVASAPGLEILEFHYCFQLTGRIMIPISTLPVLDKLVINYDKCQLHELAYETVIKDDEWKQIRNRSLTVALIDSHNLTLDFIDLFLKSFTCLKHFIMDEMVLAKLEKNSADGNQDHIEPVTFHSTKNTETGFKRYRDVKIFDQVRSKCGNMFSESMLRKIKERNPEKSEAVDVLSHPLK